MFVRKTAAGKTVAVGSGVPENWTPEPKARRPKKAEPQPEPVQPEPAPEPEPESTTLEFKSVLDTLGKGN